MTESSLLYKDGKGYTNNIINTWYQTKMTSNTAPAPLVASASTTQSTTYAQWKAFDGIVLPLDNQSSWSATSTQRSGWLQLDYGKQMLVNKVSITILEFTTSPKSFQILGSNNNSNWDTLLDVKDEVWKSVGSNEEKTYHFENDANYRYYRINISTVSAPNKQPMITELKYGYERAELIQVSPVTVESFKKYGKLELTNLDVNMNIITYVSPSTTTERQLSRKPLSIRIT